MARLPALITTIAALDGRPAQHMAFVARKVREAGLIQTTKRGRGAAEMTALDAAYLMLGIYGSEDTTGAARAAETLSQLAPSISGGYRLPTELAALRRAPDLAHALAATIELGGHLSPDVTPYLLLLTGSPMHPLLLKSGFVASFIIKRPRISCSLVIGWRSPDPEAPLERLSFWFTLPKDQKAKGHFPVETETRISTRMFIGLHRVLFPPASEL